MPSLFTIFVTHQSTKTMLKLNNSIETWVSIKDYEGRYEISSLGRIKSLKGKMWGKNPSQEKTLSLAKAPNGYLRALLYLNGKRKLISVHRVVAVAFHLNPENKATVNHINGIKTDNRAINLEWLTQKENITHSFKSGLSKIRHGVAVGTSKLNNTEVIEIRLLYKSGNWTQRKLADKFNVTVMSINSIVRRKTWIHI